MAGYSGTPLSKKLGVKPHQRMFVHDVPLDYFDWLHPLPPGLNVRQSLSGKFDFMHVFVKDRNSFQKLLLKSIKQLSQEGMLWISWPKKSSKISSDLDENIIRDFGLAHGLVDVKVWAIDETWSALKFVIPVKARR